ncbi:MAG: hypothetical protein GX778_05965, partial [Erysipelothrix sp.]|nr:hypothetical protein [Erysipelothrix sp.]
MKRNLRRLLSMFIVLLSITVMSGPLSQPIFADDTTNKITIVHTNDMHGRMNQFPEIAKDTYSTYSLLALLNAYVKGNDVDFLFDAGDAIQGLPISNLDKGKNMIDAMEAIGYDAMTIGNHEFDFGYDNIVQLKNSNKVPMVSNNVIKDGSEVFDRHTVVEKGTFKAGV